MSGSTKRSAGATYMSVFGASAPSDPAIETPTAAEVSDLYQGSDAEEVTPTTRSKKLKKGKSSGVWAKVMRHWRELAVGVAGAVIGLFIIVGATMAGWIGGGAVDVQSPTAQCKTMLADKPAVVFALPGGQVAYATYAIGAGDQYQWKLPGQDGATSLSLTQIEALSTCD